MVTNRPTTSLSLTTPLKATTATFLESKIFPRLLMSINSSTSARRRPTPILSPRTSIHLWSRRSVSLGLRILAT